MAIVKTKDNSLAATKIEENSGSNDKKIESVKLKEQKKDLNKKKPGFIVGFITSTWEELRKSQWPSFGYVIRWGLIIIVFTTIFSISLGFFDNIFNSGIGFVDCTSPKSRNRDIKECTNELLEKLSYR